MKRSVTVSDAFLSPAEAEIQAAMLLKSSLEVNLNFNRYTLRSKSEGVYPFKNISRKYLTVRTKWFNTHTHTHTHTPFIYRFC